MIIYAIAAVIGALTNRLRGGWLSVPNGRVIWGATCALVALKIGGPSILVGIGATLGCMMGQYGGLAMGRRGATPRVSPWITMTAWGLARVALPAVVIAFVGGAWWWLVLSGLLCAPIYRAVWFVPGRWLPPGFGRGDGAATGYDPPELAEAIHGAAMMMALVAGVM